jgi:hypothetical protein
MAHDLAHLACPTAVVNAPAEVIWNLLLNTKSWGTFYDVTVISVHPPGTAHPGQRLTGKPGFALLPLRLEFDFTDVDSRNHHLGFDGRLPFGIKVREDMRITPIDANHCRVTYNCDFKLPKGLRGRLLKRFLRSGFDSGPADSLSRLKHEAERLYAGRVPQ